MNSKTRVGIVYGGRSAEHDVSLQSARNLLQALDRERFTPVLIGIDPQGTWHLHSGDGELACSGPKLALHPGEPGQALGTLVDVVFPIVHGTQGEDGCLQGLLRMLGVPFVGSDVLGSAICMDKDVSKRLLREAGIAVTPFLCARRARPVSFAQAEAALGLPLYIKPANMGSSVGVSRASNAAEFDRAMAEALRFDEKVLVEAAVNGREIECAVLGNDQPQASGCGEIVVGQGFYSYDNKYIDENAAQVVVPASLEATTGERIRQIAVQAYQALECAGLARVDVFLTGSGEVLVNELNTLPGFTRISMYPKLWQATGMSYSALVSQLLDLALERHQARQTLQVTR
ncbi:D-alanine--D-alanine ligase [Pseudomonas sp. NPDC007930]|uniref:D-alanine--D-alanine ligase n=1 Tax=Pseudomonas sp. NPDC007930 TaxID=3364417 RepID=UPI0036E4C073